MREWIVHYNEARPHRDLDLAIPIARSDPVESVTAVQCRTRLGGLLSRVFVCAGAGSGMMAGADGYVCPHSFIPDSKPVLIPALRLLLLPHHRLRLDAITGGDYLHVQRLTLLRRGDGDRQHNPRQGAALTMERHDPIPTGPPADPLPHPIPTVAGLHVMEQRLPEDLARPQQPLLLRRPAAY